MKKLTVILFIFQTSFMLGQYLPKEIKIETVSNYEFVHDSIEKIINKSNSIIIETCSGFSTFFITKDSSHWKGYFIVSLARGGSIPNDINYTENGISYLKKAMQTSILTFVADSLHNELIENKILYIKQITQKELEDKYNETMTPKIKNIRYCLPSNSHDCTISITIFNKVIKKVSYANAIITQKQLQTLLTIEIFNNVRQILEKKIFKYYR